MTTMIGNHPGWLLTFHHEHGGTVVEDPVLSIGTADYHAEIRAGLPGDLSGGTFTFTVEAMIDRDYGLITGVGTAAPSVVRLHLFWHDTNETVGGYLTNLAGLSDLAGMSGRPGGGPAAVAELSVTRVTRRLGNRSYETVVEARERVYHRLATQVVQDPVWAEGPLATAVKLGTRAGVAVRCHVEGAEQPAEAVTARVGPNPDPDGTQVGANTLRALQDLGRRMEHATTAYGRGMYLIRHGQLHMGVRAIPLGGRVTELSTGDGLLEVRDERPLATEAGDAARRQFTLLLKGRPDIFPGDVVQFAAEPEDLAVTLPALPLPAVLAPVGMLATAATASSVRLYVTGVLHESGRTKGFATTVSGVELRTEQPLWDGPPPAGGNGSAYAGAQRRAGQAVDARIQSALRTRRPAEVGEVRRFTATAAAGGAPPGQSSTVWRGLSAPDGGPGQAARLPVERARPAALSSVPYLTPFAWGGCGLVLPRYPGTRVLVTHRDGAADDPVDAGALWESGKGPPGQPGDWWLSTPVGVPEQQRTALADDAVAQPHTGAVANDLTDADGVRIIEIGQLIVRVGADANRVAGRRPERGEAVAEAVTIEHSDGGSKIVVRKDGTIELRGSKLVLDAGTGEIQLNAKQVTVNCDNMNVQ